METTILAGAIVDGKYKLLSKIGEGGMGAVFEAEHVETGERVAVKLLLAEDLKKKKAHVRRFHREARAAGSIDTDHIARVIDTGSDSRGRPYMIMELMEGEDLGHLLRREGPIEPDVAVAIAAQACRGLARAHDAGVIHRDIKPANVFLSRQADDRIVVKLCDFGIAKLDVDMLQSFKDSTLTKTGALLGSPLYMAPEQARGKRAIDHRADLWSMGIVLYRMLAGRTPFQAIDALGDLIIAICTTPVPPVQDAAPWVRPEIAAVLHHALRLRPDERYRDADEMGRALAALVPTTEIAPDMLVGLGAGEREVVAERAELAAEDPPIMSGTHHGLSHSQDPSARESRRPVWLIGGAVGLAIGALGVYAIVPDPPPSMPTAAQGSGSAATASSAPVATTSAPPPPAPLPAPTTPPVESVSASSRPKPPPRSKPPSDLRPHR